MIFLSSCTAWGAACFNPAVHVASPLRAIGQLELHRVQREYLHRPCRAVAVDVYPQQLEHRIAAVNLVVFVAVVVLQAAPASHPPSVVPAEAALAAGVDIGRNGAVLCCAAEAKVFQRVCDEHGEQTAI